MSPKKNSSPKSRLPWTTVIKKCIVDHPDVDGVSRHLIKKYAEENYQIQIGAPQAAQLSKAISSGEMNGIFALPKGPSGRVKLASKSSSTRDTLDLSHEKEFVALLDDIQSHLLKSQSTRAIYVKMAKKIFHRLPEDVKAEGLCTEPQDNDFKHYIQSHWPELKSFVCLNGLTWGFVKKKETVKTNEINILSDIVISAERSAAGIPHLRSRLPTELYKLVLTVIILHELSHAFTKFFFDNIILADVDCHDDPKLEWYVEEKLIVGKLQVEWVNKQHFRDMERIHNVVWVYGSNSWKLSAETAKISLASLKQEKFIHPLKATMVQHTPRPGAVWASITKSMQKPTLVPAKTFTSFVGDDREMMFSKPFDDGSLPFKL